MNDQRTKRDSSNAMIHPSFSLLLILLGSVVFAAPSSLLASKASFVPPASPTITTSCPAPTHAVQARQKALATGYGTTTALWSKKKPPAASKKVQVKMLKYVAGTGNVGDIVSVTPAFFQNKLRPTKSAVAITNEEIEAELSEKRAKDEAMNAAASRIKEQLSDFTLELKRKTGPDGHLFGAVSTKTVLEELRNSVKDPYLDQKQVKVISVTQDGEKLKGDIKHVGKFGVNIALTKEINAKFDITVQEET